MQKPSVSTGSLAQNFQEPNSSRLTQSAVSAGERRSGFGAHMSPAKKGSLQNIFFMSSPLHAAAKVGPAEVERLCKIRQDALSPVDFQLFLDSHANKNGQTALHVATQTGSVETVQKLMSFGAQTDPRDVNGRTCWLYAGRYGHLGLVKNFLETATAQCTQDVVDSHGDSILHLAATHGHVDVIKYLVAERNFNVNRCNSFNETALHKAARVDRDGTVQELLNLGADRKIRGRQGKARHVASSAVVKALLKAPKPLPKKPLPAKPVAISRTGSLTQVEDDGDEDDDDDDEERRNREFEKLQRKLGESPSVEVTRFELLRVARKTSKFIGGESRAGSPLDDERHEYLHHLSQYGGETETKAVPAVEESLLEGFLSPPAAGSGIQIESRLKHGLKADIVPTTYLFEPYRALFSARHFNYTLRNFETPSGARASVVMTVPAVPEIAGYYQALLRTRIGYVPWRLPVMEVEKIQSGNPAAVLSEWIRMALDLHCTCYDDVFNPQHVNSAVIMAQARIAYAEGAMGDDSSQVQPKRSGTILGSLRKSIMSNSSAVTPSWNFEDGPGMCMELMQLEVKLGLPRTLAVGVVAVRPNQDEAEAMANPLSKELEQFLGSIASPIDTQGWSGYSGGLSTKEHTPVYYTTFGGIEIVFHVCPSLSETQRRQFVGNDKVQLLFLEQFHPGDTIKPAFRGHVNSVACVVTARGEAQYQLECYHRIGMFDTKPKLPSDLVAPDKNGVGGLRDLILTKIVNSHVGSYHLLYGDRMRRAWEDELVALAKRKKKSKKK